jgi:hypothetical protein
MNLFRGISCTRTSEAGSTSQPRALAKAQSDALEVTTITAFANYLLPQGHGGERQFSAPILVRGKCTNTFPNLGKVAHY